MNSVKPGRSLALDAVRGLFVVLMAIYHAFYIAVMFGMSGIDLYAGWWWLFPRGIAAGFIFLSGWSLEAKRERGGRFGDYARRALRLALPAACVSAVSAVMFGRSWVFFGILHLLALSALVSWPFLGRPRLALVSGILAMAAGLMLGRYRWDWPWLAWLGFRPSHLYPADYLPLLPWFAWCLFGMAAKRLSVPLIKHPARRLPSGSFLSMPIGALAFLGRHSLSVYLSHLPALYGIFWLLSYLKQASYH